MLDDSTEAYTTAPPSSRPDGTRLFHRFTLQKVLGRGPRGIVWLAYDDRLRQLVALKLLPESVGFGSSGSPDLLSRTGQSRPLTHPHIARIFDFLEERGAAAIAMEYVDGLTLAVLREQRRAKCFGVREITPWVAALCDALAYAHECAGVIHLDLKPSNLMVNNALRLKITDFGIASLLHPARGGDSLPQTRGALHYHSPQQLLGEKPSPADDIYSLGATLYELLSSKPPFHGGELASPTLTERRLRSGITGEAIPPYWEATIAACLEKDPVLRPRSAAEVARRLHLHGTIRLTAAREISLPRFRKRQMAALAGGIAALIGAGYFALEPVLRRRSAPLVLPEGFASETRSALLLPASELESQKAILQVQTTPPEAAFAIYPGLITAKAAPSVPLPARSAPATVGELLPGPYTLFFRHEGWPEERKEIFLQPGETLPLDHTFRHGRAHITSTPEGAEIFAGQRSLGKAPLTVPLPPGRQTLRARYPERPARKETVMIKEGATVEVKFPMFEPVRRRNRVNPSAEDSFLGRIGQGLKDFFSSQPPEEDKKQP